MEKKKEDIFKAFTAKAVQRLKDKKVTKYETLYVPSIDQNIKIRNLNYPEIVECTEIDDKQDPNASDKYCIYLAVVEPDLRAVAMELKDQGEISIHYIKVCTANHFLEYWFHVEIPLQNRCHILLKFLIRINLVFLQYEFQSLRLLHHTSSGVGIKKP